MKLRELYEDLLKTGDLYEMYFDMTGDYTVDRKKFKIQQESLESQINNLDIYLDESE